MNIEKVIEVNSRIEVALDDGENHIFGQSLIQEVLDDTFSVMIPVRDGHALYFGSGDNVIISMLKNNVRYSFKTEVLGKKKDSDIRLLVLKKPQKIDVAERRNLVRIKTLLPAKFEIIGNTLPKNWQIIEPLQEAYITNLSGKGLNMSLDSPLSADTLLVLSLRLQAENINVTLKLLGKVVRYEQVARVYRTGVIFMDITQQQEDIIISYVFQYLRKSIQLIKDDD